MPLSVAEKNALINNALEAQLNAYCPYSNFAVGASILNSNGEFFKGVNVENASYGATICAERSAICAAITSLGISNFCPKGICVTINLPSPGAPCGMCRQVLAEFGDFPVLLHSTTTKSLIITSVSELTPMSFTKTQIDQHQQMEKEKS
ncbi:Cytidine deaminase [Meloidogyne graminicola]|uniref:Cytidine deaminase n=1 Tax=Meloidogyne graminicola TaxID=189291 RepID=A0A8S9ZE72_9BILA|nr:Cytidine deaminase [Meloidogyne graminicola]